LLVAPVVEEGAKDRKIYLPCGEWKNMGTSQVFKGPRWITESVNLSSIPYFEKQ